MHNPSWLSSCKKAITFSLLVFSFTSVSAETLTDSNAALKFVLSEDRVPNASTVKLEHMKMTRSDKTHQWTFQFRDEDKKYTIKVNAEGDFKFSKSFDENGENKKFWAQQADAVTLVTAESYADKAKVVVDGFNPTFKSEDKAIVEYFVCKPPKKNKESKYDSGCKNDEKREWWEVFVKVKAGEETFYRKVEFQNDLPVTLSRASMYGNW